MSDVSQIDGNAVRLRRESLALALADVATLACLSVKQVRQIEEGGMTAFYSETVKLTAARKVAGLLSMNEKELFGQQLAVAEPQLDVANEHAHGQEAIPASSPLLTGFSGALSTHHTPITRSEALHVLAQPPEHVEEEVNPSLHAQTEQTSVQAEPQAAEQSENSGSGYFLKILALFVVALAAAAVLKPGPVEEKPLTPAAEVPAVPVEPMSNPSEPPPASLPLTAADTKSSPTETKPDVALPKAAEVKPSVTLPAASETKPANLATDSDATSGK